MQNPVIDAQPAAVSRHLVASRRGVELAYADDTYNALSCASNGIIYFVASTTSIDKGGEMYAYDPSADTLQRLADLTEVCGEKGQKAVPQGKSHVRFYECNNKLYFATHVGHYEVIDGIERMPANVPPGYSLYPGGHILSYDLQTGAFEDLVTMADGEGVITMTMDCGRQHIYAITWPNGDFIHYDSGLKKVKNLGPVSAKGEAGMPGNDYRVLCRSMFIDQKDGSVYFSTSEGDVFTYKPYSAAVKKVEGTGLRLDYFGKYDPVQPGSMGYNWRKVIWHPREEVAYGVHGSSGYLFRLDPRERTVEIMDRLATEPSKKSGMFSRSRYGSLGLQLGPDDTLYYFTSGPAGKDDQTNGSAGDNSAENLHLITYHIPSRKYTDHGPVFYEDGSKVSLVNSIAITPGGDIYTLSRAVYGGKKVVNLLRIDNPFRDKQKAGAFL